MASLPRVPLLLTLFFIGLGFTSIPSLASPDSSAATRTSDHLAPSQKGPSQYLGGIGEDSSTNCSKPGSSIAQGMCAETSYDTSNKILGELYQIMLQKVHAKTNADSARLKTHPDDGVSEDLLRQDNEIESRLIMAERAWTQFRNANCYLVAASRSAGGSGEPTENIKCLNNMTLSRISQLQVISDNLFNR